MKEFALRHPFITFLMLDSVCATVRGCVQIIVDGHSTSKSLTKRAVDDLVNSTVSEIKNFKVVKNEEDEEEETEE